MISIYLVPIGKHLRVIITIAPKRVRVQVALVPMLRPGGGWCAGGDGYSRGTAGEQRQANDNLSFFPARLAARLQPTPDDKFLA